MNFNDRNDYDKSDIKAKIEKIYDIYAEAMFRYAIKELKDDALAEECTQRSYEKLMKYVHKFDEIDSPATRAYVMKVVKTCAVDIWRDTEETLSIYDEDVSVIINSSIGRSSEERNIADENKKMLSEMMESALNDRDRRLLELFYGEGMSGREVAEELGISESACRKRMERMRKKVEAYMLMNGYIK